jgi:hypothetical protein
MQFKAENYVFERLSRLITIFVSILKVPSHIKLGGRLCNLRLGLKWRKIGQDI